MAKSRADAAIVKELENIVDVIKQRVTPTKKVQDVLMDDLLLCGRLLTITNLFMELPHLRLDDPELLAILESQ